MPDNILVQAFAIERINLIRAILIRTKFAAPEKKAVGLSSLIKPRFYSDHVTLWLTNLSPKVRSYGQQQLKVKLWALTRYFYHVEDVWKEGLV